MLGTMIVVSAVAVVMAFVIIVPVLTVIMTFVVIVFRVGISVWRSRFVATPAKGECSGDGRSEEQLGQIVHVSSP
ncbi:MAG: hypothetical protein AAF937_07330 [Planctomycetota bacterium]|jgi:hypothetical protein